MKADPVSHRAKAPLPSRQTALLNLFTELDTTIKAPLKFRGLHAGALEVLPIIEPEGIPLARATVSPTQDPCQTSIPEEFPNAPLGRERPVGNLVSEEPQVGQGGTYEVQAIVPQTGSPPLIPTASAGLVAAADVRPLPSVLLQTCQVPDDPGQIRAQLVSPETSPQMLIQQLASAAEALSYRVIANHQFHSGGVATLYLKGEPLNIACILPDTDDVAAEADRIVDCLRSGCTYLLVCSEAQQLVVQLKMHLSHSAANQMARLRLGTLEATLAMLQRLTAAYRQPETWMASTGKRFQVAFAPVHRAYPALAETLKQSAKQLIREGDV